MMNFIQYIFLSGICCSTIASAQERPLLHVGTEHFNPPFVMQGAKNELFGFDIDIMNALCNAIQHQCKFHTMRFDQLLDAVAKKELDVAISSITITAERIKTVNFSTPYLLSYSRFLTNPTATTEPFDLTSLNGKRIGVETGTVFVRQLEALGVKNPKLTFYSNINNQLTGLSRGETDFILLDNSSAIYWASNAPDAFKLAGLPYMYGYGPGIAVSPGKRDLLPRLNQALLHYQNSADYRHNYNRY